MSANVGPQTSHRALRALLLVLAVLIGLAGVITLFGTTWLYTTFITPAFGVGTLITDVILKYVGVLALVMAYLLYTASRDPVRYVAVIDAFAGAAILFALIDMYSVVYLGLSSYYSPYLIWGRAFVRLALAGVLIAMRPRGASTAS
jgi:hypothetical protein